MMELMQYSKAPIVEAVIDIRVDPNPNIKEKDLKKAAHSFRHQYPDQSNIVERAAKASFTPGRQPQATAEEKRIGFRFSNHEKTQVWQARKNGFTFSRLPKYENWTAFRDEAKKIWEVYRNLFPPVRIQRLAVRYVNRIDILEPRVELESYFRTFPQISDDLPQNLDRFFMQIQISIPEFSISTLINHTVVKPVKPNAISIVLDIDVFRSENLMQEEDEIWSFFEQLRRQKNLIFEACITDKTRELIK